MPRREIKKLNVLAEDLFTDREEPRKAFWDLCDSLGRGEYGTIAYYGVGGIGKTTLLKKLQSEVQERKTRYGGLDSVFISFENKPAKELILLNLCAQMMMCNKSLKCHEFIEAYATYCNKTGKNPEQDLKIIKSITTSDNPLVDYLRDFVLSKIPFASDAYSMATKVAKPLIDDWQHRRGHEDVFDEIRNSEPRELVDNMHTYLYNDLCDVLNKRHRPVVIFLDGYENFADIREDGIEAASLENDYWLKNTRDGLWDLPNTIWVLAGREVPRWDEKILPPERRHRIGNLSSIDASLYFRKAGINPSLCRELFELTKGTPVFMDLCVDTYRRIKKNREPVIEDFGENADALTRRYLKYMKREMSDMVVVLSCLPNTWTIDLAKEVAHKAGKDHCVHTLDEITTMSLVERVGNEFKLHETIRSVIRATYEKDEEDPSFSFIGNCDKAVLELLGDRIDDSKTPDECAKYMDYFLETLYRIGVHLDENLIRKTVSCIERVNRFKNYVSDYIPTEIFSLFDRYLFGNDLNPGVSVFVKTKQACFYRSLGNRFDLDYAHEKAKEAMEIAEQHLKEDDRDSLEALLTMSYHYLPDGKQKSVLQLAEKGYELSLNRYGENDPLTIRFLDVLAVETFNSGDKARGLELQRKAYKLSLNHLGEDDKVYVEHIMSLAHSLGESGEKEKAIELYDEATNYYVHKADEGDFCAISQLRSIARDYYNLGKNDNSLKLSGIVYDLCISKVMEGDLYAIIELRSLAKDYHDFNEKRKSLKIYETIYDCCISRANEGDSDAISQLSFLSRDYYEIGEKVKSFDLCDVLSDLCITKAEEDYRYAIDHCDVLSDLCITKAEEDYRYAIDHLDFFAHFYREHGEKEECLKLYDKISDCCVPKIHEDALCVIGELDRLISAYIVLGENKKAVNLYDVVSDYYVVKASEGDLEAIDELCRLAKEYQELGEKQKSIGLYDAIFNCRFTKAAVDKYKLITRFKSLAQDYSDCGENELALKLYDFLSEYYMPAAIEGGIYEIRNLESIAKGYGKVGERDKAINLCDVVSNSCMTKVKEGSADAVDDLFTLSWECCNLGEKEKAIELCDFIYDFLVEREDKENTEITAQLGVLAYVYYLGDAIEKARNIYNYALNHNAFKQLSEREIAADEKEIIIKTLEEAFQERHSD